MKKVEVLVALRGNEELWPAGTVFDHDDMPGEIANEIALGRGTVRVFEEMIQRPAVPPQALPSEDEPSFSEVAKLLLVDEEKEEKEAEDKEAEDKEKAPRYSISHQWRERWNVIDQETGEKMNEDYLTKDQAIILVVKLQAELVASGAEEAFMEAAAAEKPSFVEREEGDSD